MSPCLVTGRVVVPEPADLLRDAGNCHAWPACPWSCPWPGGSVRRRGLGGVPFLLDLAEVPDGQGDGPGQHEDTGDDEPGLVDVEVAHEGPEPAGQVELLADQAKDLDGADEHRDKHRQPGDGQV